MNKRLNVMRTHNARNNAFFVMPKPSLENRL